MKTLALLVGALIVINATKAPAVPSRPPSKVAPKDPVKEELKKLQGSWEMIAMENNGRQYPQDLLRRMNYKITIKDTTYIQEARNRQMVMTLAIDPTKKPKTIDLTLQTVGPARVTQGIYLLDGDILKICQPRRRGVRPKDFQAGAGTLTSIMTLKRIKP